MSESKYCHAFHCAKTTNEHMRECMNLNLSEEKESKSDVDMDETDLMNDADDVGLPRRRSCERLPSSQWLASGFT